MNRPEGTLQTYSANDEYVFIHIRKPEGRYVLNLQVTNGNINYTQKGFHHNRGEITRQYRGNGKIRSRRVGLPYCSPSRITELVSKWRRDGTIRARYKFLSFNNTRVSHGYRLKYNSLGQLVGKKYYNYGMPSQNVWVNTSEGIYSKQLSGRRPVGCRIPSKISLDNIVFRDRAILDKIVKKSKDENEFKKLLELTELAVYSQRVEDLYKLLKKEEDLNA